MAFTLNLGDLIKFFHENGKGGRQVTATWLLTVAAEAAALAKTWDDIYAELYNKAKLDPPDFEHLDSYLQTRNAGPYRTLEMFYRMTSQALGGKYKYQEELTHALGSMLCERNVTKAAFEKAIRRAVLNAGEETSFAVLPQHIHNLYQQAAVLNALAKSFRA